MSMHHGEIGVTSGGEGLGSTFHIALPAFFQRDLNQAAMDPCLRRYFNESASREEYRNTDSSSPLSNGFWSSAQLLNMIEMADVSNQNVVDSTRSRGVFNLSPRGGQGDAAYAPVLTSSPVSRTRGESGKVVQDEKGEEEVLGVGGETVLMNGGGGDLRQRKYSRRSTKKCDGVLLASPVRRYDPCHDYRRALVVDDSDMNRKMMCRSLRKLFHFIDEACDGEEAVLMVKQSMEMNSSTNKTTDNINALLIRSDYNNFSDNCVAEFGPGVTGGSPSSCVYDDDEEYDVIFMDFVMPKMNGPDATREIRALGFTGKVIGVTGNALPCDIKEFQQKGADAVLIKPVELDTIRRKLDELIPL